MKNMRCGFGASCKFHHPELAVGWVPAGMPMAPGMIPMGPPAHGMLPPSLMQGLPPGARSPGGIAPLPAHLPYMYTAAHADAVAGVPVGVCLTKCSAAKHCKRPPLAHAAMGGQHSNPHGRLPYGCRRRDMAMRYLLEQSYICSLARSVSALVDELTAAADA